MTRSGRAWHGATSPCGLRDGCGSAVSAVREGSKFGAFATHLISFARGRLTYNDSY